MISAILLRYFLDELHSFNFIKDFIKVLIIVFILQKWLINSHPFLVIINSKKKMQFVQIFFAIVYGNCFRRKIDPELKTSYLDNLCAILL